MNWIEINKYIGYKKLFVDLYEECENQIHENSLLNDCMKYLIEFHEFNLIEKFNIQIEDSQFADREIIFVFGYNFNDANESDTQGSSADYCFIYDRDFESFTDASYNQG